jgi:hypothetical protein
MSGSRNWSGVWGVVRVIARSHRASIRRAPRRGGRRVPPGASVVLSVAMRGTVGICCRSPLSMRSLSIGLSAAVAATFSPSGSVSRLGSRRAGRLKSCRMTVRVIEHRAQRLCCPDCGAHTRAVLPAEVTQSAFGARLQAAIATLSVRNRISRRDVVEFTEELFCARISAGAVDAILARASQALAEPHADLLEQLRSAGAVNMDETGWRTAGERRALWGIFDQRHAYLHIAPARHEDHAKELLADTNAIVTSDRWWAYAHLPLARRQLCWGSPTPRLRRARRRPGGRERVRRTRPHALPEGVRRMASIHSHRRAPPAGADHRLPRRGVQADHQQLRDKTRAQQALPRDGTQPHEGVARALDIRHPRRRAANQQPRRARSQGRGHLPQAQPRQSIRRRRTPDRATVLGTHHLPPTTPLTVRLPQQRPRRPRTRRPGATPHLTRNQLNAYTFGVFQNDTARPAGSNSGSNHASERAPQWAAERRHECTVERLGHSDHGPSKPPLETAGVFLARIRR